MVNVPRGCVPYRVKEKEEARALEHIQLRTGSIWEVSCPRFLPNSLLGRCVFCSVDIAFKNMSPIWHFYSRELVFRWGGWRWRGGERVFQTRFIFLSDRVTARHWTVWKAYSLRWDISAVIGELAVRWGLCIYFVHAYKHKGHRGPLHKIIIGGFSAWKRCNMLKSVLTEGYILRTLFGWDGKFVNQRRLVLFFVSRNCSPCS